MRFINEYTQKSANTPEIKVFTDKSTYHKLAKVALTGVLNGQYYKSEDKIVSELTSVVEKMAIEDPIFLLKAAKASRALNMKLFPKLAVAAVLSKSQDKSVDPEIEKILATYNPNQLLEFILMLKNRQYGSGLGSRSQKLVARGLARVSAKRLEDWTLSEGSSLNRILRLVHPTLNPVVKYVLKADKEAEWTDRQRALETIKMLQQKREGDYEAEVAALIKVYNLPFNSLKGVISATNKAAWDEIAENMSVIQLLINLKSLDNMGVMTTSRLRRLLDAKFVKGKTRILPFDIMRPMANADAKYRDVLIEFLEKLVLDPIPSLEGKTVGLIFDGSGSMGGPNYAGSPWMTSMALGLPLMSSCNVAESIIYSTTVRKAPEFRKYDGAENFKRISEAFPSGGTNTDMAIDHFTKNNIVVDVLVLITDEQQNGYRCGGFQNAWARYRKLHPEAELLIVNATPYEWHMTETGTNGVTIVQTLTPAVYQMIQYQGQDMVDVISNMELGDSNED
jgi:hypothetical protein